MGAIRHLNWVGVWVTIGFLSILMLAGCSQGPLTEPVEIPDIKVQSEHGRTLWGLWEIVISPEGDAWVVDARTSGFHANVIDYLLPPVCPDCLILSNIQIFPVEQRIEVDVTLKNNTSFLGNDVRGIMMSNVGHDLYNADDYTDLWDDGGDVTINPFKRFPADPAEQIFPPGYSETNHYSVKTPSPMKLAAIHMAVDASWPKACKEPFNLGANGKQMFGQLCENGGDVSFYIDVLSHFAQVESVILDMSPIGGNEVAITPWTDIPGLFNYFAAFNIPFTGTTPGDYELWVKAKTEASPLWLYDKIRVTIYPGSEYIPTPIVMGVIDYPFDESAVAVKDGNLYALGAEGLRVYSIGLDGFPSLIGQADAPPQETNRYHLYLDEGLAFGFFERWEYMESKLAVYDISDPANPVLHDYMEWLPVIADGCAKGDFLLCSVPGWNWLATIDATDPDNLQLHWTELLYTPYGMACDGDNLFLILENRGVGIYSVSNPLVPSQKGTYYSNKVAHLPIDVADEKGYIWTNEAKLIIFSYSNPNFPAPISTTELNPDWVEDTFTGFHIDGNYLFPWGETVYVVDVSDPDEPAVVFEPTVPELTPHTTQGIAFYNGFAYAPIENKLEIIKCY
jgi:hypothetical protein